MGTTWPLVVVNVDVVVVVASSLFYFVGRRVEIRICGAQRGVEVY
jgi:hypothetical protein